MYFNKSRLQPVYIQQSQDHPFLKMSKNYSKIMVYELNQGQKLCDFIGEY